MYTKTQFFRAFLMGGAVISTLACTSTISQANETVVLHPLQRGGSELCLGIDGNNFELERCNGSSDQQFTKNTVASGGYQLSINGRCITALFEQNSDLNDSIRTAAADIRKNVKIKAINCNETSTDTEYRVNIWRTLSAGKVISENNLPAMDICFNRTEEGRKLRAQPCQNDKKVGAWSIDPAGT